MESNRYRKILIQPFQPVSSKKSGRDKSQFRPKALSLGKSVKKLSFNNPLQSNCVIAGRKKVEKQFTTLNLKQRRSIVSNKNGKKRQLLDFQRPSIYHQKPKSLRKTPQLPGLSKVELNQIKESHLNTYFNIRKNKLKQITKENQKIYERINSQQSLYSSRELNRSVDSVSHSRMSQKSSINLSKKPIKSKSNLKTAIKLIKEQSKVKFQSKDINKLQNSQVNRYLNIFCNRLNVDSKHINHKKITRNANVEREKEKEKEKQNSYNIVLGLQGILQQVQTKRQVKKRQIFGRLL